MSRLSVAIDGPAGAGKSTVARRVAAELGLTYVDTGAMYRAITWKILRDNENPEDEILASRLARDTDLRLTAGKGGVDVWVDGEKVTEAIRTPEVTSQVSRIAGHVGVRKGLTDKQRAMARQGGVVMDGRDIGTQVMPDADVKVFLTASIEERAQRRYQELMQKGFEVDPEQLREEIRNRDEKDRNREHSPFRPAEDAVHLDTTGLSIDEVVQSILTLCQSRVSGGE